MAKKDEKAKAVTQMQVKPNPLDDGIRPGINAPDLDQPIDGGGFVFDDHCGTGGPRFPRGIAKERIKQIQQDAKIKPEIQIPQNVREVAADKLKK